MSQIRTSVKQTNDKLQASYDLYKGMLHSPAHVTVYGGDFENSLDIKHNPFLKKYEVNESVEDLLALSTTWFRLRKDRAVTPMPVIDTLTNVELNKCVTEEDRQQANVIRDYYSKKIMLWTLKEVRMSRYREDLSKYIHGNSKVFTDDTLPLVYRLPEFYEYDMAFAEVKQEFDAVATDKFGPIHRPVTLTPVKNLTRKLRSKMNNEYWLKDDNGVAYLILIEPGNSCKSLWDREFKTCGSMRLECAIWPLVQDDLPYYKVTSWKLAE